MGFLGCEIQGDVTLGTGQVHAQDLSGSVMSKPRSLVLPCPRLLGWKPSREQSAEGIVVLGLEPRALCALGKSSAMELRSQTFKEKKFFLRQGLAELLRVAPNSHSSCCGVTEVTGVYHSTWRGSAFK